MKRSSWVSGSLLLAALLVLGACKKKDEPFEVFTPPVPASSELPKLWALPDFALTERSGRVVKLAEMKGLVWVADFFYTSCPGPCPMLSSRLSEIHKATRNEPAVRLVSISTDPLKDTPEVLQQYAQRFGADERWLFLTGEKDAIYALANTGFKLGVSEEGATLKEPVTHSTKLALVDREGVVRGFYDGTTPADTGRLLTDIRRLLKDSQ